MKQKLISLLIVTMIIAVIITVIALTTKTYGTLSANLDIKSNTNKSTRGSEIIVIFKLKDIVTDTIQGVSALSAKLSYDTNIFETVTKDNIIEYAEDLDIEPMLENEVSVRTTTPISEASDYIGIKFKVKENASLGNTIITFTDIELYNYFESAQIIPSKSITIEVVENSTNIKTLSNLEMTTPPKKTDYKVGEVFNSDGMVITAKYSDDTKKEITNYDIIDGVNLKEGQTNITIRYSEGEITKEIEVPITVTADGTPEVKVLSSIKVKTKPTKMEYTEGEKFDKTGMVVTAKYSNGSEKVITEYTYSPNAELKTTDTKITISYKEDGVTKTTTQTIKVKSKTTNPVVNLTDKTTSDKEMDPAGLETIIIPAIVVLAVTGIVAFIKYRTIF